MAWSGMAVMRIYLSVQFFFLLFLLSTSQIIHSFDRSLIHTHILYFFFLWRLEEKKGRWRNGIYFRERKKKEIKAFIRPCMNWFGAEQNEIIVGTYICMCVYWYSRYLWSSIEVYFEFDGDSFFLLLVSVFHFRIFFLSFTLHLFSPLIFCFVFLILLSREICSFAFSSWWKQGRWDLIFIKKKKIYLCLYCVLCKGCSGYDLRWLLVCT